MAVRYEEDEKPEVSLTSMMDCIFLMLIFFLVSSQLKKIEKEIRDLAAAVPYPPEMPFRPGDWQPAADIVQKLTLGKATPVQFFTALTEQYDKVQVLRGTKQEWERFIGWIYCRCWALGLKDKWVDDILKRKFEPFEDGPSETGRRVAELARKLADTTAEIEGVAR